MIRNCIICGDEFKTKASRRILCFKASCKEARQRFLVKRRRKNNTKKIVTKKEKRVGTKRVFRCQRCSKICGRKMTDNTYKGNRLHCEPCRKTLSTAYDYHMMYI